MSNLKLEIKESKSSIFLRVRIGSETYDLTNIPKELAEEDLFNALITIKKKLNKTIRMRKIENRNRTATEIAMRAVDLANKFKEYIESCEKLNDLLTTDVLTPQMVTSSIARLWNKLNEWRINNDYTDKEFEAEKWKIITDAQEK